MYFHPVEPFRLGQGFFATDDVLIMPLFLSLLDAV